MCHQVIEKALKAYFVKHNDSNPTYTHNLMLLAEKSGIYDKMTDEQKDFLDFLESLNIEVRSHEITNFQQNQIGLL
jgi:HEPN domain-containing protein